MNDNKQALFAYLATLAAIVLMTVAAVIICMSINGSAEQLAKVVAALAFIGAATTGLIGVIGTFRPKGPPAATTETGDVNLGSSGEGKAS